jgi:hypothetical protein
VRAPTAHGTVERTRMHITHNIGRLPRTIRAGKDVLYDCTNRLRETVNYACNSTPPAVTRAPF